MYDFALVQQSSGSQHKLETGADGTGSITVGRKVWGITEKRISRQQVQLEYDSRDGKVTVQQLGPNDSVVKTAGHTEPLGQNRKVQLHHGDRFWLLDGLEEFMLKINPEPPATVAGNKRPSQPADDDEVTDDERSPKKKRVSKPRQSKTTKRIKRGPDVADGWSGSEEDEDYFDPDDPGFVVSDDEDEDEDEYEDDIDDDDDDVVVKKRECMYGVKCYRKNPDHFQEFAHPWLDKPAAKSTPARTSGGSSSTGASGSSSRRTNPVSPQTPSRPTQKAAGGFSGSSSQANTSKDSGVGRSPPHRPQAGTAFIPRAATNIQTPQISVVGNGSRIPPSTSSEGVQTPPARAHATTTPFIPRRPTSVTPPVLSPLSTGSPRSNAIASLQGERPDTKSPSSSITLRAEDPRESGATPSNPAALVTPEIELGPERREQAAELVEQPQKLRTLAFPSLGTKEGQIDLDSAAACLAKSIKEFRQELDRKNLNLILIDDDEATLSAYRKALPDEPRFRVEKGELATIRSASAIDVQAIVVETSWRWKASATAVCRQVHRRAGPSLLEKTHVLYTTPGEVGKIYPVDVPHESPLFTDEAVEKVLYVVAPNMNPLRAHCLSSADEAVDRLRVLYSAILEYFVGNGASHPGAKAIAHVPKDVMTPRAFGSATSWSDALIPYCMHPEKYPDSVVSYDTQFVIMNDKFPAKKHFLIMPRSPKEGLSGLSRDDLPLLDCLKKRADELIAQNVAENSKLKFRAGFHAVPSMKQLHLHVISQDFDSVALKNKKHWNSFTTSFFKDFDEVQSLLQSTGSVKYDHAAHEALLKGPLLCHICKAEQRNMPSLKQHIAQCGQQ
ncbi:hypothetical protein DFJ77DRAFT_444408 [Powellomyces hirtus]|nr:hypothetical protein DFJ77DRAFT_444408 [Powellomyces hirtus]